MFGKSAFIGHALSFYFIAFSSRELETISLENALGARNV
jgi:hypothetical protein